MRIRSIKPEFWSSLTISRLELFDRLMFIGLWNFADDEGRGSGEARLIRAALWPLDDDVTVGHIQNSLDRLARAGVIVRYVAGGKAWFAIRSWGEHQSISKPRPSNIPEPPPGPEQLSITEPSTQPPGALREPSGSPPGALHAGSGTGNREQGMLKAAAAQPHSFVEFWQIYPRKVGKRRAESAYRQALGRVDAGVIRAGAARLAADPNLPELQFIPHPTTWLNRDGWEDDPFPSSNGRHSGAEEGVWGR